MAQIARDIDIDTDWLLDYMCDRWAGVGQARDAWDAWDIETRLDFLHEWPIAESYWEVLREQVRCGRLSSDQMRRFQKLSATAEGLQPFLNMKFGE